MRRTVPALLLPAALIAQAPSWDGDFVLDPDRSEGSAEAVRKATEGLNFALKPVLRLKLEASEKAPTRLSLLRGTGVTLQVERNPPFTAAPGQPAKWKRSDGETFEVAMEPQGAGFTLAFTQDGTVRSQRYALSEDGKSLTVEVTLRHPKVPEPVRYKLTYRRAG